MPIDRKLRKGDRVICYKRLGAAIPGVITDVGNVYNRLGNLHPDCQAFLDDVCEVRLSGTVRPTLIKREDVDLTVTQEIIDAWKKEHARQPNEPLGGMYVTKDENVARETKRCPPRGYKNKCRLGVKYLLRTLEKHSHPDGILLDAGCRDGSLRSLAKSLWKSLQYEGIDIVEHHIELARAHGRNCSVMDFCELRHEDESVAVVYSHHSLEHVWSTVRACREAFRVLKPGGLFVIAVPLARRQVPGSNLRGDLNRELVEIGFIILRDDKKKERKPGYVVQRVVARKPGLEKDYE